MSPIEILSKLIKRAYWWANNKMPDSVRNHTAKDWEPGRMVETLSSEERQALKGLTSEHVSQQHVSEEDMFMATSQYSFYDWKAYTQALKTAKEMFDTKIKKHIPGRQKKYGE